MSKKTIKMISIVLTLVMVALSISTIAYATSGQIKPSDLNPTYNGTGDIKTVGQNIMGIVQTVAVVIAVVILMVLGIKYMMGSAEEKAEYKKTMMPYLIGAILVFAAGTIANAVYNFATGL